MMRFCLLLKCEIEVKCFFFPTVRTNVWALRVECGLIGGPHLSHISCPMYPSCSMAMCMRVTRSDKNIIQVHLITTNQLPYIQQNFIEQE